MAISKQELALACIAHKSLSKQQPFEIATAQKYSVYWLATQQKFANVGKFFMRLKSFRLEDAPGGSDFITKDEETNCGWNPYTSSFS